MNKLEHLMVDTLTRAKDEFGVVSVKAEFEAEGTRFGEVVRLAHIARSAGLPMTVKIGGCEAVRDLLEVHTLGVRYVVAPMVETAYAASKFVSAKNMVFDEDEQSDIDFLLNLETITSFNNFDEILETINTPIGAQGMVFGRSDFIGSLGIPKSKINDAEVTEYIIRTAEKCKSANKDLVVGGTIGVASIDALRAVNKIHLTRFETRKVVFGSDAIELNNIEEGLQLAVEFERLWLMNKRDHYGRISSEDSTRIDALESRK